MSCVLLQVSSDKSRETWGVDRWLQPWWNIQTMGHLRPTWDWYGISCSQSQTCINLLNFHNPQILNLDKQNGHKATKRWGRRRQYQEGVVVVYAPIQHGRLCMNIIMSWELWAIPDPTIGVQGFKGPGCGWGAETLLISVYFTFLWFLSISLGCAQQVPGYKCSWIWTGVVQEA